MVVENKRAVAIAYNWKTEKVLFTPFDGDGAGINAMNWVDKESFVWKDFPEHDGWTHFYHCNKEAAKEKGDILTRQMFPELFEEEKWQLNKNEVAATGKSVASIWSEVVWPSPATVSQWR